MIRPGSQLEARTGALPITEGTFSQFAQDPIAVLRQLHQTHGEITALRDGTQQIICVFGPRFNREILTDLQLYHSRFFAIRGPRKSPQRNLTSGLLSMNDEEHKRHRRLLLNPFSRKSIETYLPRLVDASQTLLADWRPGQVREIHRDMTDLMLRITSSILFGFDQLEHACRLGRMIERWVEMNHELGVGALVPDDAFSRRYDELMELAGQLEAEIMRMVHLRRQEGATGNDVLSILVRTRDEQGGLTDQDLIGQACVLFGAAHLTSANTLSWTLLLLAQHPQVMADLHDELAATLGGRPPALSDIERLPLLERVIKESMRVLPGSSYSQRTNTQPVDLGPFRLSPGTSIIFSAFITHHMPELFEEPNAFPPERWEHIDPSPYAYLPFGAGPRLCLGTSLAMMTFKVTLPILLQRFKVSCLPHSEVSGLVKSTMLSPSTPLRLKVDRQDGCFSSCPLTGNIHDLVNLPPPSTATAHPASARNFLPYPTIAQNIVVPPMPHSAAG